MDRPVLSDAHTTTWSGADMEVVALASHHLGVDVHAILYAGAGPGVPIAFLATSDPHNKHFRALVGKTVPVRMIGDVNKRGDFVPDALQMHRERHLKKGWFTPRARSA